MIRNLVAHVYPRKCGQWRHTVNHLLANWDQFTGRKIVTVARDDCCDSADDVLQAFEGRQIELIVRGNIPELQEVAGFATMLEMVNGESGITLYCHAKGATHADPNAASHKWRDAMAAACLEYPQLVECIFETGKHICGAFRSHGLWSFPGYHNWHFAGTWFWFRNELAFALDWRNIHPNFMGVEAWPGIFPPSESGCLFYDNANTAHLYSNDFWRDNITPSLNWWRKSLAQAGLVPPSANSFISV